MTQFLIFRLYGPMVSWGEIAPGTARASADRPTRSAVLGLLAGCLGIERAESARHAVLEQGLGVAFRVDVPGTSLTDYHTAQAGSPDKKDKKKPPPATRKQELELGTIKTVLSDRGYLMDAMATALVWRRDNAQADCPDAEALAQALQRPVFMPYLGRKACPPGLPFEPQVLVAETGMAALAQATFKADAPWRLRNEGRRDKAIPSPANVVLRAARRHSPWLYCSAEDVPQVMGPKGDAGWEHVRRDRIRDRAVWLFDVRREARLQLPTPSQPRAPVTTSTSHKGSRVLNGSMDDFLLPGNAGA